MHGHKGQQTASAGTTAASEYRPDIEGLRGIAILSVVLYHLDPRLLPGGFTGVDVFFVISGFLITGILLREYQTSGRIDLLAFWARRARRILPSASLVLAVSAVLSLLMIWPLVLKQIGRDILTAAIFGLNWRAASRAVDYSDPGEDLSPVIHYWSLAVEEQFYVVWPILLIALFFLVRRTGLKPLPVLAGVTALILAGSLAYCLYLSPINQPQAFFGTFTRVWQLLAGASAAVFLTYGSNRDWRISTVLGPVGLFMIALGFILIMPKDPYPGMLALLPVTGAAMVILAGAASRPANWASRILSVWPLTFVGRVSYVWYLWHWPILFFAKEAYPTAGPMLYALALSLSFAAAVATHYFFENPLRFHPLLVQSKLRSQGLGLAMVAVMALAGYGLAQYARGMTITFSDGRQVLVEAITRDRSPAYDLDCHASQIQTTHAPCIFGKQGAKPEVVLFGDSHAAQFFDAVNVASTSRNTTFLMRSKSGCPAIDGLTWSPKFKRIYIECDQWRRGVLSVVRDIRPKLMILSNVTGYVPVGSDASGEATIDPGKRLQLYNEALRRMIVQLLEYADRVVIIADTPRLPEEVARCLYRNPANEQACVWPAESVISNYDLTPAVADLNGRASIVDLNPLICPQGVCRAIVDGKPVFYDQAHISSSFSKSLAGSFEKLMMDAGL